MEDVVAKFLSRGAESLRLPAWRRCLLIAVAGAPLSLPGAVLYSTSFNNPPFAASGPWAGVDGWLASDPSNGSAAVTSDGGAVYLGGTAPAGTFSLAGRPFRFDPVASGTPIVKIRANIAVFDSTNSKYDVFGLGLYNFNGDFLGAILFNNANNSSIYADGSQETALPGSFRNGSYFAVSWTIDFSTNRTSATAINPDGAVFPLFTSRVFHAGAKALNLGDFDALWAVNSSGIAGDNYLVMSSLAVEALAAPQLSIDKGTHQRTHRGQFMLRGQQSAEDDVVIQVQAPGRRNWAGVKGSPARWSFAVKKLEPGRNLVTVRMLNAAGAEIDREKIVILRR